MIIIVFEKNDPQNYGEKRQDSEIILNSWQIYLHLKWSTICIFYETLTFSPAIFYDFVQLYKAFLKILKYIQTLRLRGYTSDK